MIQISEQAKKHIQTSLNKENKKYFHLSIKKMGCSGYAYQVNLKNEKSAADELIEIDDINILIDKTWASILNHISIDYVEDAASPLKTKKLIFSHPDVQEHCGCGESFFISNQS